MSEGMTIRKAGFGGVQDMAGVCEKSLRVGRLVREALARAKARKARQGTEEATGKMYFILPKILT